MILTCPECATSYFVDDSRIAGAGRTVKCSNCGARWTARPEGAEAAIPPPKPAPPKPAPPPAAAPAGQLDEIVFEPPPPVVTPKAARQAARKAPAAASRDTNGRIFVLGASAVLIVSLIAGLILFRAQVVNLLPASQAAYAGLGLPVSSLVIEKVHAEPAFLGGRAVLSVSGQLRNLRDDPAVAPALRVSLLDRFGKAVSTQIARPLDAAVPAHATRYFAITMTDPPAALHDLQVTFEPAAKVGAPAAATPVGAVAAAPPVAEAKPAK